MNKIIHLVYKLNNFISTGLPGKRIMRLKDIINFQKGGTLFYVLFLMFYYNNFNKTAYSYLSLHGTYGMIWLIKDRIFPDKSWERRISVLSAIMCFALVLGPYWVSPYLIIKNKVDVSNLNIFLCTMLHTLGCVVMMCSDTQKYFELKLGKKLINNGWFKKSRNTNYLGEMMIYSSYALLGRSKIPYMILSYIWLVLFYPNMIMKDLSIKRKEGGKRYISESNLLLPL